MQNGSVRSQRVEKFIKLPCRWQCLSSDCAIPITYLPCYLIHCSSGCCRKWRVRELLFPLLPLFSKLACVLESSGILCLRFLFHASFQKVSVRLPVLHSKSSTKHCALVRPGRWFKKQPWRVTCALVTDLSLRHFEQNCQNNQTLVVVPNVE